MDRVWIIGGGGHALSLAGAVEQLGWPLEGCLAPQIAPQTGACLEWLGAEPDPSALHQVHLLNGIGSAGPVVRRRTVYLDLRASGWRFTSLVHPNAALASTGVRTGDAIQVLAGAVVNAGTELADNVLINSGAIVEHGCVVGRHTHIASGATVCGDCIIGESVHVGAGSTVIQGVQIGSGSVIAAGAVVSENVEPLTLVAGVPARALRSIDEQELA